MKHFIDQDIYTTPNDATNAPDYVEPAFSLEDTYDHQRMHRTIGRQRKSKQHELYHTGRIYTLRNGQRIIVDGNRDKGKKIMVRDLDTGDTFNIGYQELVKATPA